MRNMILNFNGKYISFVKMGKNGKRKSGDSSGFFLNRIVTLNEKNHEKSKDPAGGFPAPVSWILWEIHVWLYVWLFDCMTVWLYVCMYACMYACIHNLKDGWRVNCHGTVSCKTDCNEKRRHFWHTKSWSDSNKWANWGAKYQQNLRSRDHKKNAVESPKIWCFPCGNSAKSANKIWASFKFGLNLFVGTSYFQLMILTLQQSNMACWKIHQF